MYFRDVQHLLELVLLAWFWMTPIVYQPAIIQAKQPWLFRIYLLNPMTAVVLAFQRGIYGQHEGVSIGGASLGVVHAATSAIVGARRGRSLVAIGWGIFRRLESRLAEEL